MTIKITFMLASNWSSGLIGERNLQYQKLTGVDDNGNISWFIEPGEITTLNINDFFAV